MLAQVLADSGYETLAAADRREATRLAAITAFDAALLDLGLQGDDGWAVLKQLRARDPKLPVVIVTAWPHQQGAAAAAGADACCEKPLDFAQLLETVARLTAARREPSARLPPPQPRSGATTADATVATIPRFS